MFREHTTCSYDEQIKVIERQRGDYLDAALALVAERPTGYMSMSTCISKWWVPCRFKSHVMVLDCDSMPGMLASARSLKLDNIGYVPVQSSPEHYWLVTNYVGTLQKILTKMAGIPGIDMRHRAMAKKHQNLHIRAMPRATDMPLFTDDDSVLSKPVRKWYRSLKALYDNHGARIQEAIKLSTALHSGEIMQMAADPSFAI